MDNPMSKTDISIIIATRHREDILWETVEKACLVAKDKNIEVIVINDGDAPLHVPYSAADKIYYLENPKRGVSAARNFGASLAKGDILFFLDDDMWINNEVIEWINTNLVNAQKTEAVYYINWEYPPPLKRLLTKTKIGRYLLSTNYHTLWGRLHKNTTVPPSGLYQYDSVGSGSLVMHKKIFNALGGYNERLIFQGEDADLAGKLNHLFISIYIVFDVTLYHNHKDRLEINNFLKRSYEGFGSEFKGVKKGMIIPLSAITYRGIKKMIFEFSRITEKGWILLLNALPNHRIVEPLNNKLIGSLGGLQRYKQWRNIIGK
ncbi:MAG: glycosyltransferase [Ginsengibacter sp.]